MSPYPRPRALRARRPRQPASEGALAGAEKPEWAAAQTFAEGYVLAIVDFYGSDKAAIWYVRDPAGAAMPVERPTTTYRLLRLDLEPLGTEAEFL